MNWDFDNYSGPLNIDAINANVDRLLFQRVRVPGHDPNKFGEIKKTYSGIVTRLYKHCCLIEYDCGGGNIQRACPSYIQLYFMLGRNKFNELLRLE